MVRATPDLTQGCSLRLHPGLYAFVFTHIFSLVEAFFGRVATM
jgi:hypothetical protein